MTETTSPDAAAELLEVFHSHFGEGDRGVCMVENKIKMLQPRLKKYLLSNIYCEENAF